jgi:hypothetical protein
VLLRAFFQQGPDRPGKGLITIDPAKILLISLGAGLPKNNDGCWGKVDKFTGEIMLWSEIIFRLFQ